MKLEKGTILFGKTNINFSVKRSKRKKTVSIFVDPFEGVFLRTPLKPSLESLSKLVHSKAAWILSKQSLINETLGHLPKKEFVTGESFLYLGRQLRLKILRSKSKSNYHANKSAQRNMKIPPSRHSCEGRNPDAVLAKVGNHSNLLDSRLRHAGMTEKTYGNDIFGARVAVKGGKFLVSLNSNNNDLNRTKLIREILSNWYKKHARKVLLNRVKLYSRKLKVSVPEVMLANQTKRWGSCNGKGRIRLNWHIIMAPMSIVDYVVAHELCHLRHNNHSENFWKFLGSIMPDYETRRERLRKEGHKFYF